ncbi:hypothetical protein [Paraburkholderia ferrariae]|uniref:hypothetical protein n=1 Tax=Paraburkholderia ferrariae TaxID=386056 RepID=UPI0012EB63F4|nr:hypothetical protein [Paraburkholderia ferrariae]
MFFKSFTVACRGAPHARAMGYVARLHALIAAPAAGVAARGRSGPLARRVRTFALRHATRAAALAVRAALRTAWTGRPLTPCGYAILGLTVAGVVLALLIAVSPAGDDLDSALPLSWWFA